MTPARRLGLVLLAGLVPWVVVVTGPDASISLVFAFGFVSVSPVHVTPIWIYAIELADRLGGSFGGWPVAAFLYLLAIDSATLGWLIGREDRRLTGGLLVVAGLSLVPTALAVGRPTEVTAVAVGTTCLWLVAWVGYRDALKQLVTGPTPR